MGRHAVPDRAPWSELAAVDASHVAHSLVPGLFDECAQDGTQRETLESGVLERGIKVHGVVVATAFLADMQHSRSSQVSDDSLNLTASKRHRLGKVVDSATLVCGDAEEHGAVTGDVIPVVRSHGDCLIRSDPGLCHWWRGNEGLKRPHQ